MDAIVSLLGNVTVLSAILFIIGIVMLGIEFFVPGFGVFGVTGIVCLIVDVAVTAKSLAEVAVMLGIIVAILCVFVVILLILGSKGLLPKFLVLGSSTAKDDGFSATLDYSELVGLDGIAATSLHPAGKVEINGKNYDVVSNGEFIDAGSHVKVITAEGNIITVKKSN